MKAIIAAGIVFCVALIGAGYYFAVRENTGPRQVELNAAYTKRVEAGGWTKGATEPKVTLVEYGDFQCPACGFMYPILQESMNSTKDIAQLTFRHFPLTIHDKAKLSAAGAEAAGMQGKFWEMHDLLYTDQEEWANESPSVFRTRLERYATALELNVTQFKRDLDGAEVSERILKDSENGDKVPVEGTPTLVLNGKVVDPTPRTAEELTKLIREAAQNAGN